MVDHLMIRQSSWDPTILFSSMLDSIHTNPFILFQRWIKQNVFYLLILNVLCLSCSINDLSLERDTPILKSSWPRSELFSSIKQYTKCLIQHHCTVITKTSICNFNSKPKSLILSILNDLIHVSSSSMGLVNNQVNYRFILLYTYICRSHYILFIHKYPNGIKSNDSKNSFLNKSIIIMEKCLSSQNRWQKLTFCVIPLLQQYCLKRITVLFNFGHFIR